MNKSILIIILLSCQVFAGTTFLDKVPISRIDADNPLLVINKLQDEQLNLNSGSFSNLDLNLGLGTNEITKKSIILANIFGEDTDINIRQSILEFLVTHNPLFISLFRDYNEQYDERMKIIENQKENPISIFEDSLFGWSLPEYYDERSDIKLYPSFLFYSSSSKQILKLDDNFAKGWDQTGGFITNTGDKTERMSTAFLCSAANNDESTIGDIFWKSKIDFVIDSTGKEYDVFPGKYKSYHLYSSPNTKTKMTSYYNQSAVDAYCGVLI